MMRRALAIRIFLSCLRHDRRGVTAVEFAVIAPVFFMLLLGAFDMGHMIYAHSALTGAVQAAARSASLESRDIKAIDAMVTDIVRDVVPDAAIAVKRTSYFDFADIGRPEPWNDRNSNGQCDNSENFTDQNGNGSWDSDMGSSGGGGANDVVVYRVEMEYTSPFAVPLLPFTTGKRTLVGAAVRQNQPFAEQAARGSAVGTC